MKIAISYPSIDTSKGVPLLSQNRQFQYFNNPTYIYPVVPAYAATMLKEAGYKVAWLDAIAERWQLSKYLEELERSQADILAIESKTPTIKPFWKIIDDLKKFFPKLKIVLMGDHVTAMPLESMENSKVDFVLTGGDFDFALLNLVNFLSKKVKYLEPGVYYRDKKGKILDSGHFKLDHTLKNLPLIDRELTRWWLYAYANGNFKYTPGTYTMIGRDCWWRRPSSEGGHGCTFCSWTSTFPTWRVGTPKMLLKEVKNCLKLGIREIFDDTGTFPIGPWLKEFCEGMIDKGYHKKIKIGCNMRANGIKDQSTYDLMGKAGFRFILYGLESASQNTLDRLNKGTIPADMVTGAKMASKARLEPHVTCMVGYPWESKEEAETTVARTKELFNKGWINTLQATIVIPYPGTALFRECEKNKWLKTRDWNRYDMREPIMKSPIPDAEIMELTQKIYTSFLTPRYILRKLSSIRSMDDVNYYIFRGGKYIWGHLKDFAKSQLLKKSHPTLTPSLN
ncbi:MAG: radical SAM protein [Candidatus Gottesmanbacteria bacterium GW2011_GWA2_43_14]|uniref:Radical SAM protein n=1 Tax=Candidatus Gottesmanbacteria bacterium GW2011_GWA2_43_14 TaxID=1618443 RepID=A0A0G1DEM2_9BACT|nr:MAG: radical SAM protein [Candidatus Gottesmanbacteria bacterium GW2011_GWA2_43_14]